MYRVSDGVLYKQHKNGNEIEICRVLEAKDSRLLVVSKTRLQSYIFKIDKARLQPKLVGNSGYSSFVGRLLVYVKPHYQELHNVIMSENHNRYSLANARFRQNQECSAILDDAGILENMLEFIIEI